jgi:hypothetical protein
MIQTHFFIYWKQTAGKILSNVVLLFIDDFSSFTYGVINQFLHIGWFSLSGNGVKTLICPMDSQKLMRPLQNALNS